MDPIWGTYVHREKGGRYPCCSDHLRYQTHFYCQSPLPRAISPPAGGPFICSGPRHMGQVAVGAAAPSRRLRTQVFKHLENQQPHGGAMLVSGGEIVLVFWVDFCIALHNRNLESVTGCGGKNICAIICHSPTCLDRAFQTFKAQQPGNSEHFKVTATNFVFEACTQFIKHIYSLPQLYL